MLDPQQPVQPPDGSGGYFGHIVPRSPSDQLALSKQVADMVGQPHEGVHEALFGPQTPIVEPYESPVRDPEDDDTGETRDGQEQELVGRLDADWAEARAWFGPVRIRERKAREFYDGEQWAAAQRQKLKAAGKPDLVTNKIAKAIDNITGRERASRYNWNCAPNGNDAILASAAMTHGLKAIANQTDAKYEISEAFEDAMFCYGIVELAYDDSTPDEYDTIVERVPSDEFYFDPFSRHRGFKDCRYTIRVKVMDLDTAESAWPAKVEQLRSAVTSQEMGERQFILSDYDNLDDNLPHMGRVGEFTAGDSERSRVEVREHQYWVLEQAQWIRMPDGRFFDWDETQPMQMAGYLQQGGERMSGRRKRFYVANVCQSILLDYARSKYPWPRFNYVPIWCKRDRDGRPYGLVDVMIDSQKEVNVNLSRANEALRSRHLIHGPGALGNTTQAQAGAKLAQANFVLEVADPNAVKIGTDAADAAMFVELMDRAEKHIDDAVGNNDTAYGDPDHTAVSGKAKQLQVAQQALVLGKVFDNLKYARLQIGEMLVAIMQKFYTVERLQRIIHGQVLQASGVGITPQGSQQGVEPDLQWLGKAFSDDITQLKFDVQIEDVGETATERQAQMDQMTDVLGLLPDNMKLQFLPDLIRASDWVGSEAMAGKIEQMIQQQSQAGPDLKDYINAGFKDLPAQAQRQWLQEVNLPTDLTPSPAQQQGAQKGQEGPRQPPPLNPNTVMSEQGKMAALHVKAQHEASQASIQRTHEEIMAARLHQQHLEAQAQAAKLAPKPRPSGGASR